MKHPAALLGLSIVLAASAALAAPSSVVEKSFGNTIVSTYPDGRQGELWLQRGGTYTAEGRRHDRSSGHWKVKGGKLCLSQSSPVPVPFTYCTAIPSGGVGSTWSAKAVSGEAIRVKLVKGHVSGR
jgi:hypothetical protein